MTSTSEISNQQDREVQEQARQLVKEIRWDSSCRCINCQQREEASVSKIVALASEAATAALEQAARLAETMASGETFETGRQKAINIAAVIRTMRSDAAIGDDKEEQR